MIGGVYLLARRVLLHVRIRALLPLISRCQIVTLFDQDVESSGLVAVADVEQDLAAHSGVAIVPGVTVHAHHAVDAALFEQHNGRESGG